MFKIRLLRFDVDFDREIQEASRIEKLSVSAFIRNSISWRLKELRLLDKIKKD